MAWNVDRLGRSLKDLVAFLSELHALGIDLFLHQQGDTTTPAGKAMFQMFGVFAEFEHSIIQERVRAGLQRAKREGKREALAGGMSVRKTAAKFDVNPKLSALTAGRRSMPHRLAMSQKPITCGLERFANEMNWCRAGRYLFARNSRGSMISTRSRNSTACRID